MSRSSRAWAKGCELVGAAASSARRLSGREVVRDHLVAKRLVRTAPSLATLTWVATSVVLMLAFAPAVASGKSVNRKGRVPATRAADIRSIAEAMRESSKQRRESVRLAPVDPTHPHAKRRWSELDDATLRRTWQDGGTLEELTTGLGRPLDDS